MDTQFYTLTDNRCLGVNLIEIYSIPNISEFSNDDVKSCERIRYEFESIISEIHRLLGGNTCMEILWITQDTQNQTFTSEIRIFVILRKIGDNKKQIAYELENTIESVATSLSSLEYNVGTEKIVYDELMSLIEKSNFENVYSVSKGERCSGNSYSAYPYYYTDVISANSTINFNSIVATLSGCRNCAISFQLFPVQLSQEETFYVNELVGELGKISNGMMIKGESYRDTMAVEPLKVYMYYNEHRNSPLFTYNILSLGNRSSCASLATKISSLLQSGDNNVTSIDPVCIDLTADKIDVISQFPYYVWNVNTNLMYRHKNTAFQKTVPLASKLRRLQYMVTVEEAVTFFRLPLYEKNMASLKCNKILQAKEQFSEVVVSDDNIKIGKLISNSANDITIGCPEKAFTKHVLIVGTPGSGKTTFSVNLLLQFAKKGIPFLAIEPTKSEYRAMIDAVEKLRIFTPGNNSVSPFIINPFIPPKGVRIEQYIPSLVSAFKAAFSMPSPLDMIFHKAIRACYIQYGWKDYSKLGDSDVTVFGLHEFIIVFRQLMDNTTYSNEVRGNIESAGLLRLTNLIEQNSNIYDSINTIPIEDLLTTPTVLELNAIDNAEQKSLIMALLLINICVYTKSNQNGDGNLKNVILIDEAHVLLGGGSSGNQDGSADAKGTTVKALQDMIAEIRSYGTSIIIADQAPTKVSREVVANTDIKVSFRLVQADEKKMIADSSNMDNDDMRNLGSLHPGEAYVYYSQLSSPQMVITEDIREKEGIRLSVSDQEIATRSTYWDNHSDLLKPYIECAYCCECNGGCDFILRSNAEYIANIAMEKYRTQIKTDEDYRKCIYHLAYLMDSELKKFDSNNRKKLEICTKIKVMRKIQLELQVQMNEDEKKKVIGG